MLDKKYERYWDELDISDEWREFLESQHDEYKKSVDTHYRHTRSLNNMSSDAVYKLIIGELINAGSDSDSTDSKEIIKGVSTKKLMSAMETLTKKQQLALGLYIFGGYTQVKIAEIMKCSQSSTSELIARATAKIKAKLNK